MSERRLATAVHSYGATRAVLAEGDLDVTTVDAFRGAVALAIRARPEFLLIDLASLDFVAVAGVKAVADACRRAAAHGIRVGVIPPDDHVRRVFEQCGVESSLPFLRALDSSTLLEPSP
jgi:anti-anti-sigma factor